MIMAIAIVSAGSAYTVSHVSASPVATNDAFALVGHVTMVLTDETGMITQYRQTDNVVTNDGLETILDLTFGDAMFGSTGLNGVTESTVSHMAMGNQTSPTAAAVGNTALQAEVTDCARIAIVGLTSTGQTATLTATFDATSDAECATTVTELGLFTESTNGAGADQLFARQASFSSITLTTSDSLAVTWTVGLADDGS